MISSCLRVQENNSMGETANFCESYLKLLQVLELFDQNIANFLKPFRRHKRKSNVYVGRPSLESRVILLSDFLHSFNVLSCHNCQCSKCDKVFFRIHPLKYLIKDIL